MAAKLTKAERETLMACPSWSSPYEVALRRHKETLQIVSGRGTQQLLSRLKARDLVEHHLGNWTYRITDAGRQALSLKPEDGR